MSNAFSAIPVIPATKQYWLVRTQGGRYYRDYKNGGFIGINWDDITIDDINRLSPDDLTNAVKELHPDKPNARRTANQLRIFTNVIKAGDTVIITSYSSNELTIGEVLEDTPYTEYIDPAELEADPRIWDIEL